MENGRWEIEVDTMASITLTPSGIVYIVREASNRDKPNNAF